MTLGSELVARLAGPSDLLNTIVAGPGADELVSLLPIAR